MIWKNGRFHLNRTVTVLTFLIFALFSVFFLSSSALAVNLTNVEYSNFYTDNWTDSNATTGTSGIRTNTYSLPDIVDPTKLSQGCGGDSRYRPNCFRNAPYNWFWESPQGIKDIFIQYNNVTFTNNAASLHFELNYVITEAILGPYEPYAWLTSSLDELAVIYSDHARNYSNISYALTPWTTSVQSVNNRYTFYAQTLTIYGDISFVNLSQGSTENIFIQIGLPDQSAFIRGNNNYRYYQFGTFIEQNPTTINFFATPNEALQEAQINAINVTNQLLQKQYDQDQQDRMSVQNVSDNSNQDGSDASTNAENATSSLLGAITNIYNQLLHPTTSNCIIEGVQIYDMNLGNLDFCTGFTIPQPVFAIGALIMIGLIILLAWSILKAGMSLYNELLGGKT